MQYYIYFLRSASNPQKTYIGYTNNLARRLREHNSDLNPERHTFKHRPWNLETYALTKTKGEAKMIEAYFKNSSAKEAIKRKTGKDDYQQFMTGLEIGKGFGSGSNRFVVTGHVKIPVFSVGVKI